VNIGGERVRVLYSFPHKLGGARLSDGAWHQVNALAAAGTDVLAFPGVLHTPVAASVKVRPTLAKGKLRIPYKVLGKMRALALHDHIVARRLKKLVGKIDVIHTYAAGSLETLRTARDLGIPTVLERTNAHTRFAFEVVGQEFERLGVTLPPTDEYYHRADLLAKEEAEYRAADYLLCPSDFVAKTFIDRGFPREKLLRFINGVDEKVFYASSEPREPGRKFTMLFVGVCAVRKGVHFALEAWLNSPASRHGNFLIAGDVLPGYVEKLAARLSHPSVSVLGHVEDVPGLMRKSDVLVLPSIEEGFGRVITEAMASGCVPLASDACTDFCRHLETGLRHRVGDVQALAQHITMLYEDRALLAQLRSGGLAIVPQMTWAAGGVRLVEAYRQAIAESRSKTHHKGEVLGGTPLPEHTVAAMQTYPMWRGK
jgi:glycosyltransferase involved in cell wall biosynthesis